MKKTKDKSVFATLLVVACIGLVLVMLFFAVDSFSHKRCEETMADALVNTRQDVVNTFNTERDMLRTIP